MVAKKVESKKLAMTTRRTAHNTSRESNVPSINPTKPTRLTPQQLEETREKGLCFNCDNTYSKGNKCDEKSVFYIHYEEDEADD